MTTTIEDNFGSRLMTESGFLLNNELTDFSFVPSENGKPVANRIEAGKRPRSSMSPTIVYDRSGRIYMIVGSPGGSAIINYVAKTLIGVLDWGLDPQAAIALPNFGSRNGPTELEANTRAAALEPKLQGARSRDTRDRADERCAGDRAHEKRLDRAAPIRGAKARSGATERFRARERHQWPFPHPSRTASSSSAAAPPDFRWRASSATGSAARGARR